MVLRLFLTAFVYCGGGSGKGDGGGGGDISLWWC